MIDGALWGIGSAAFVIAVVFVIDRILAVLKWREALCERLFNAEYAVASHKNKLAALPRFGVCEICGGPGFADGMTKMTGKEYDDLRGVVGLNRCLIHNHVVHIHDECLRRAGYVHEYGVVAGWRKVAAKKGKG